MFFACLPHTSFLSLCRRRGRIFYLLVRKSQSAFKVNLYFSKVSITVVGLASIY